MKTILAAAVLVSFALAAGFAIAGSPAASPQRFVLMAATIGPIDAGIVDALESGFEKETGIRVRHVGAGTGAALDIARQGSIDLVLVHARVLEEKFVADGFGTGRIPLMFNDFVIVGPAADPAGIRGMKTAAEALRAIADRQAPFVTRGDNSGTHVAELGLWEKAGVKPAGAWYDKFEKGSTGNVPTLKYADEKGAYTVMDRATLITVRPSVKCEVLVENDEAMLNHISLIPVNPAKFPQVNHAAALEFARWMTDAGKGQMIIRDFGKDQYGSPLFFPESESWKKAQGR
jgi:tungstate transport system substrate-binding protein